MAQRAPVLTLERQSLRSALDPGQYHHLFQADYLELARLADPDIFLRTLDVDDATQKGECEHILSAQAVDPRCTAVISIVLECRGQDGSKKRRRMLSELTAHFPTQNQQGRKINQGPGGDLSFLPATHPLICKQSCKYTLLGHDGEWSSKREVRQPQCCLCLMCAGTNNGHCGQGCLQADHSCKISCYKCMGLSVHLQHHNVLMLTLHVSIAVCQP